MARLINSPGVQISEKDLSLRVTNPAGTNILVPGFSSQGPVGEPIVITSAGELEAIYGVPTTPAEKYFYYSCREALNSPGVLTTLRLPYGPETGSAFSNSYSALFYPAASGVLADGSVEWVIGEPKHVSLSPTDYAKYLEGQFFYSNYFLHNEKANNLLLKKIMLNLLPSGIALNNFLFFFFH